jgi:hypothetical protein
MPLIDLFNRGGGESSPYNLVNHTPDGGSVWSAVVGNFVVSPDGSARNSSTGLVTVARWTGDVGADDYEVAIRGQFRTRVAFATLAAVVRCANSTSGVLGRLYLTDTAGNAAINLQDAFNPYTERTSRAITGITAGTFYYIVLKVVGTTYSLSIRDETTGLWLNASTSAFDQVTRVTAISTTITGHSTARGNPGIQDYATTSDTTGASYDAIAYGAPDSTPTFTNPATAITLTGPSSGALGAASTNFTAGADGVITGTITVTPSDGGGSGTFTPTSVNISSGTPTATFTYTPSTSGAKSITVTNNGSLTNPSALTYTPTATAVTLSGPSTCTVGSPSTPFTVGANAALTSSVTVTPSDSGGGGTFSPTSVVISSGTPTATFTYTAGSIGIKSISVTNSGGLTNPSALSVTASILPATAVTLSGPSSGLVGSASTNFTAGANGTITGTVVVTPNDSSGGGTFSPTTVSISSGSPTGTFTYTPGSGGAKSIGVTNDGSLTNPSAITYTASAATTYTVTGPSGGGVGVASTNFTVTRGSGGVVGNVTVTPSDGGGGGTFTPTTVNISNGSTSATFTYTPASSGAKTLSFTNNGGLTNPSNLTYTVTTDQTIYCDSASIIKSPSNWHLTGTAGSQAAETVWPGSYMRLRFDGTAIAINVDTTGLSSYPWVFYQIDAGTQVVAKLTSGQTVINITGLSSGAHELNLIYQAKDDYNQAGTWGDAQKLRILSFLPSGGTGVLSAPAARPKKAIIYGDSITAGLAVTAPPGVTTAVGVNAATASYANHIGIGLDAEFDQAGCGADGWTVGGVGGFPSLPSGWNLKKPSISRDISTHDYIVTIHGYNDGATDIASSVITNWLTAVRAVNTTGWIFLCVPFSGRQRGSITTGAANYITANPSETKIKVIDLGSTFYQAVTSGYYTTDGIHPNSWQTGRLAAPYLAGMYRQIIAAGGGGGSGTYPAVGQVRTGNAYGPTGTEYNGTLTLPTAAQVLTGIVFGVGGTGTTGTVTLPTASQVKATVTFGPGGGTTGNVTLPTVGQVQTGVQYGASGTEFTGTLTGGSPTAAQIATEVLAQMNATPPSVNVEKINGADVIGDGTTGNAWRGQGVSP